MIKTLADELLTEGMLAKDDVVVAGVSGGPDSIALLHLLLELNHKANWNLRVHAAHLNHMLRGDEADRDAAFVQAASDGLGVSCTIDSRDIAGLAKGESLGIEEVARRERYTFLERVCIKVGAKAIAVGHHADDNAETILHRIIRGTGLRGLAGIPRNRPRATLVFSNSEERDQPEQRI